MKILNKTLFTVLTFAILAQSNTALGMQRIRDLVAAASAKISQSFLVNPKYRYGALALGAAATAGAGWYLYKAIQNAKRTYWIGDQKIIVREGSQVPFYRNDNKTEYKHKMSWFIDLTGIKFSHADAADQYKGNAITIVDDKFGKDQKPGVQVTVYSNQEIKVTPQLKSDVVLKYYPASKKLVIEPKNPNQYSRIDCIFTVSSVNIE